MTRKAICKLKLTAILLTVCCPLAARADRFQVNDRTPGHEQDTVEIPSVQPVLVCATDLSCVAFNDTVKPSDPIPDTSPIVTAPSGGVRLLVGPQAGSSFGNLFVSLVAAVEWPISRRLELDLRDNFSPLESHAPYGRGTANKIEGGFLVWLNRSVGLNSQLERSSYRVPTLSKANDYASGGFTLRRTLGGMPSRVSFDYIREINNGITAGVESSRLQGGDLTLDIRPGCSGKVCYRLQFDYVVGRVLQQSNPICDGTFGTTGGPNGGPCPRTATSAGAFTGSFMVEFPRRRATEKLPF